MSRTEKIPKQLYITIWFAFLIIVGSVLYVQIGNKQKRISNAVYTEGIIVGLSKVAKGEQFIVYKYTVDAKTYEGSMSISFCKECDTQCCEKGSRVKVRYENENPKNSDLVH